MNTEKIRVILRQAQDKPVYIRVHFSLILFEAAQFALTQQHMGLKFQG